LFIYFFLTRINFIKNIGLSNGPIIVLCNTVPAMGKVSIIQSEKMITVVEENNIISLIVPLIIRIVCDKPYVRVMMFSKESYLFLCSLKDFCMKLPCYFIQINNSTYINLLFASSMIKKHPLYELRIGRDCYPISRRRQKEVYERYQHVKSTPSDVDICCFCQSRFLTV